MKCKNINVNIKKSKNRTIVFNFSKLWKSGTICRHYAISMSDARTFGQTVSETWHTIDYQTMKWIWISPPVNRKRWGNNKNNGTFHQIQALYTTLVCHCILKMNLCNSKHTCITGWNICLHLKCWYIIIYEKWEMFRNLSPVLALDLCEWQYLNVCDCKILRQTV